MCCGTLHNIGVCKVLSCSIPNVNTAITAKYYILLDFTPLHAALYRFLGGRGRRKRIKWVLLLHNLILHEIMEGIIGEHTETNLDILHGDEGRKLFLIFRPFFISPHLSKRKVHTYKSMCDYNNSSIKNDANDFHTRKK